MLMGEILEELEKQLSHRIFHYIIITALRRFKSRRAVFNLDISIQARTRMPLK